MGLNQGERDMPDIDQSDGSAANKGGSRTILQQIFSAGPQGVMQAAGLFFTLTAFLAFGYGIVTLIARSAASASVQGAPFDWLRDLVLPNFSLISVIVVGIIAALLGIRLFTKASELTSSVVRPAEAPHLGPLIEAANKDAINEYIRLASLTGFTGSFTKIGFTGLPLVTVALTLVLLGLTLFVDDTSKNADLQKGLFDLAKLTMGAFLGSFVQRNIEQEKLAGKADTTSSGNTPSTDPAAVAAVSAKAAEDAAAAKAVDIAATAKAASDTATTKAAEEEATMKATNDAVLAHAASEAAAAKAASDAAVAKADDNETAAKVANDAAAVKAASDAAAVRPPGKAGTSSAENDGEGR